MNFLNTIKNTIKRAGDFFKKHKKEITTRSIDKLADKETDKTVVRVKPLKIEPGKFYYFKYDAKYKDVLEHWDRNPVIIALQWDTHKNSRTLLGVNLNFFPDKYRRELLKKFLEIHKVQVLQNLKKFPENANAQKPLRINKAAVRKLDRFGFGFGLRRYLPKHIVKGEVFSISFEHIEGIENLESKTTLDRRVVDKLFKQYLNKKK